MAWLSDLLLALLADEPIPLEMREQFLIAAVKAFMLAGPALRLRRGSRGWPRRPWASAGK
jgi:hypothetical protein